MTALRRAWAAAVFLALFARDLVAANAVVAWEVLTPGSRLQPGVARVVLRARTPFELTVLADVLSLTPGTLVLDLVAPDGADPAVLYIHGLHVGDREAFREQVRRQEERVLAMTR